MSVANYVQAFRDLLGGAGVVDDPQRLATYTTDQRHLFTGSTHAVLKPATTEQVADVVRLAARLGVGVVPQGGNTSYCGGATPDASGRQVIVSLDRMDSIREVDPLSMSISVDAGAILKNVQEAAASAGLLLPLSLGAEGSCQIGGNIGTNAGGLSVVRYGMTRDLLLGIEAVLPDGTIVSDMRKLRKNNTGYDVKQCFVGSEGTLGIVTGAVLRLAGALRNGDHADRTDVRFARPNIQIYDAHVVDLHQWVCAQHLSGRIPNDTSPSTVKARGTSPRRGRLQVKS